MLQPDKLGCFGANPSERPFRPAARWCQSLDRCWATRSRELVVRPRTGSDLNDLEAISTAQGECNALAVYAFKVQRNRRYFVQRTVIVAKVKLVERNPKISAMACRAWLSARGWIADHSFFDTSSSGRLFSCRIRSLSSSGLSLISASMAYNCAMVCSACWAISLWLSLWVSKNLRRAWAQQPAS